MDAQKGRGPEPSRLSPEQRSIEVASFRDMSARHGAVAVAYIRDIERLAGDTSSLARSEYMVARTRARQWAYDAARYARAALDLEGRA